MYLQRSNVFNNDVRIVQGLLNSALTFDQYKGKWNKLMEDGYYGPETERAVCAFQYNHNPRIQQDRSGVVGDVTFNALNQIGPFIRSASSSSFLSVTNPPIMMGLPKTPNERKSLNTVYNVGSSIIKGAYATEYMVDANPSEKGLAFILNEWEKVLSSQYQGLLRRLNKFPTNKTMRSRSIVRQMELCQKFLHKASRYGIVSASKEFGQKLTKEEAIRSIRELGAIIKNSPLLKGLSVVNRLLSKVNSIINPVLKVLNKIPGLKYISVMEKIIKATHLIIQGDAEKAFAVYMDGLRELLEQLLIDAVVIALVASCGWIALVVAIVIIIASFLIDYFFFSDNPRDALSDKYFGIPTHNYMLENAPLTHRIITKDY